jgi:hypothetical protein
MFLSLMWFFKHTSSPRKFCGAAGAHSLSDASKVAAMSAANARLMVGEEAGESGLRVGMLMMLNFSLRALSVLLTNPSQWLAGFFIARQTTKPTRQLGIFKLPLRRATRQSESKADISISKCLPSTVACAPAWRSVMRARLLVCSSCPLFHFLPSISE